MKLTIAAIIALFTLTACGANGDAPLKSIDHSSGEVGEMPDYYSNFPSSSTRFIS